MAADNPKLAGFTFRHPPNSIQVSWEAQLIKHKLADNSLVTYNKGFILKGTLSWSSSWLDEDEYSNVAVMFNELTGTAKFYPRPDSEASTFYNVQITNNFDFTPHGGILQQNGRQCYAGRIDFESSLGEITATAGYIY